MDVVYELTDSTYVLGETLAITALQTKVTKGRLSLIRIKDCKEQICRLSRCAWLVWVFSMVQCVLTAGRCPKILFCIVTKSLACFCRGCCVRRLTMLAISAFIRPCPKLQYAWDSFWQFPVATHCTACTQDHWSCNPHRAVRQKAIQGSMRNMQGTMRICWLLGLPSTQKLCTNHPHVTHVLCQCSNLSACCDPFSSKTLLGKESSDQRQEKSLASSFAVDLHETSRWPQHYENDSTAWSFQTLAFAKIWNCRKMAPILTFSDTVCLSSIKTSKNPGTSETCTTCNSLRGLTFRDPGPRWNHQSSTYLSNTHLPWISPNNSQYWRVYFCYIQQHGRGLRADWQHLCLGRNSCHHSSSN